MSPSQSSSITPSESSSRSPSESSSRCIRNRRQLSNSGCSSHSGSNEASAISSSSDSREGTSASSCNSICISSDTSYSSSISEKLCDFNSSSGPVIRLNSAYEGEGTGCTFYRVTAEQQRGGANGKKRRRKSTNSSARGRRHRGSRAEAAGAATTWVCSVANCGARFRKKAHAKRHAAVHTTERTSTFKSSISCVLLLGGGRPYSCSCCSASFKRSEHLRRHYFIVHQNKQETRSSSSSGVAAGDLNEIKLCTAGNDAAATSEREGRASSDGLASLDKRITAAAGKRLVLETEGDLGDSCAAAAAAAAGVAAAVAAAADSKETQQSLTMQSAGAAMKESAAGYGGCSSSYGRGEKKGAPRLNQRGLFSVEQGRGISDRWGNTNLDMNSVAAPRTSPAAENGGEDALAVETSVCTAADSTAAAAPPVAVVATTNATTDDVAATAALNVCRDIALKTQFCFPFSASTITTVSGAAFGGSPAACGGSARFAAGESIAAAGGGQQQGKTGSEGVLATAATPPPVAAVSWKGEAQVPVLQQRIEAAAATAIGKLSSAAVRRPFACEKCGRTFVLKQHLTRHSKCHLGRYACKECDAAFAKKHQLRLHLLEHLVDLVEEERAEKGRGNGSVEIEQRRGKKQVERGLECGRGSHAVDSITRHEKEQRRTPEDMEARWHNEACGECAKMEQQPQAEVKLSKGRFFPDESATARKTFLCPHQGCGAVFFSLDRLYVHLKRVSMRARNYECGSCGENFLRFSALTAHRRVAHPANIHTCPVCAKRFSRLTRLRVHIRTRHDMTNSSADESQTTPLSDASYSCPDPLCGLVFSTRSNMRAHYRVKHMQLREFICEKCGAAFGFRAVLRRHLARVHKGELANSISPACTPRSRDLLVATSQLHPASATFQNIASGEQRLSSHAAESLLCTGEVDSGTSSLSENLVSTSMTGYSLSKDSTFADEEPSAAQAQITKTPRAAGCSELLIDKTAFEKGEEGGKGRQPSFQKKSKQTKDSRGTANTSGKPCTVIEVDSQAGQPDEKNSRALVLHQDLTCNEWIADAVQLNLMPISVDGKLQVH